MPIIPLIEPIAPDSGELPIYSSDDIWPLVPARYRRSITKPLLDNLIEALTEIALAWQDVATYAAQQSDPQTATDQYLTGLGNDRLVFRASDEGNSAYQDRVQRPPHAVDRLSLLEAVNALLAPYTTVEAQLFDSVLDRWFVTDGTASWHSFIGENPQYQDRLYEEDLDANEGDVRPQSAPGGAWAFNDRVGRYFVLRVPDIGNVDNDHAFVRSPIVGFVGGEPEAVPVMFVGDGSQSEAAAFISSTNTTALTIYQAIADTVNAILGHSVRWKLEVDPKLS